MHSQKDQNYRITAHEFCLMEYFHKYDSNQFDKVLNENAHHFTDGNKNVDLVKKERFVIENIHLLSDEKLFETIAKEAIEKYHLNAKPNEINPFSEENRKKFLDIDGKYGGICAFSYDNEEHVKRIYEHYKPSIKNDIQPEEIVHFEQLIELSLDENTTYEKIQSHIDNELYNNKNSDNYKEVLEFASNCYKFYSSGGIIIKGTSSTDWRPVFVALVDALGILAAGLVGGIIFSAYAIYKIY